VNLSQKIKNVAAALLILAGVAVPATLFIMDALALEDPFLHVGGMEIVYHDDGSVQALFDVEIRNMKTFYGASFFLDYNPKYLTPSDFRTNAKLSGGSTSMAASKPDFVQIDPDLYEGDNPFDLLPTSNSWQSGASFATINTKTHYVALNLTLEQSAAPKGKVSQIIMDEYGYDKKAVIDTTQAQYGRVVLAQISFQVDPQYLPHLASTFEGVELRQNPRQPETGADYDYLLDGLDTRSFLFQRPEPWQIDYYDSWQEEGSIFYKHYNPTKNPDTDPASPVDTPFLRYTFDFPKTLVDLRPLQKEVTVDAYQAYTDGTLSDVAAVLGKYSPMAELTFTDAGKESRIIPWNSAQSPYTADDFKVYTYAGENSDGTWRKGPEVAAADYDPTHGEYIVEQYLYVTYDRKIRVWGDNPATPATETYYFKTVTVTQRTPEPVLVHLTVTPITLVDVTADDLHKTYALNADLLNTVTEVAGLGLPGYARLTTDVPVDGATLLMDIPGWNSHNENSWPVDDATSKRTINLLTLLKDDATDTAEHHWPTQADLSSLDKTELIANRTGTYSFDFATGGMGGTTKPDGFDRADIQAKYPWLTVPEPNYPLGPATRTVVAENEAPLAYTVTYVSTIEDTNGHPTLTLQVERADGKAMTDTAKFRVLLPDGTPMGVGSDNADSLDAQWDDWFAENDATQSHYNAQHNVSDGHYHLITNPGIMYQTDNCGPQRTALRRYINLGGYFYVSINEMETPQRAWTDYIPVYVPPRENKHIADKVYNFIGENAGLFQYPGGLSTTFTVPPGDYTPVSNIGEPTFELDADNHPTTTRVREDFGAPTTYDGITGDEPGRLYTMEIVDDESGNIWFGPTNEGTPSSGPLSPSGKNAHVYRYGASEFVNGATYPNFGPVTNPDRKTATLRRETALDNPGQREKISLKYVDGSANFGAENNTHGADGNLDLSTFDSQREGYATRQEYTYVIKNEGTVPIYDLALDLVTDDTDSRYDAGGGHFEIVRPPASYLDPGQETTFTLTYVYDLDILPDTAANPSYLDTIFITSSAHHKGAGDTDYQAGDYTDHLLDFDATFLVTDSDLYQVTVVCDPAEGMGSAGTVVGLLGDGSSTPYTMNLTSGSATYMEKQMVYVVVRLEDEYSLDEDKPVAYAKHSDGTGENLTFYPWKDPENYPDNAPVPTGEDGAKTMVYFFEMPADDVTVTVTFVESDKSKLRLGDLRVYADDVTKPDPDNPDADPITKTGDTIAGPGEYHTSDAYLDKPNADHFDSDTGNTDTEYNGNKVPSRDQKFKQRIFTKTFTDKEKAAAQASGNEGRYLSTVGRANLEGFAPSADQYLVVIPADAEYAEVTARLRQVVELSEKNLGLTGVTVQMDLYDSFEDTDESIHATAAKGFTNESSKGADDGPTTHYSAVFDAPEQNASRYVRITTSTSGVAGGSSVERFTYVEIHRMGDTLRADLNYGNSPYGMIMNDDAITNDKTTINKVEKTNKEWAKEAFLAAGRTFAGVADGYRPAVVDDQMKAIRYHTEAWVKEPPASQTAVDDGTRYEPETHTDLEDYLPANDMDLNDYALFVYGGSQEWADNAVKADPFTEPGVLWGDPTLGDLGYNIYDSSGRRVDITAVERFADVPLLDTAASTQLERFATDGDTQTVRLYLPGNPSDYDVPAGWTTAVPRMDTTVTPSVQVVENGKPVYELAPADAPGAVTLFIRPGVYDLVYTYLDFDGSDPVADPDREARLPRRPFIILTRTGDVNADGRVVTGDPKLLFGVTLTASDERQLKDRVSDPLGYLAQGYTDWAVFRFRVCDANNDRNVNNIDANELDRSPRLEYYKATDYGFTKPTPPAANP